jgi:hypothetical protein
VSLVDTLMAESYFIFCPTPQFLDGVLWMIVFQEAVYLCYVSGTGNSVILPQNMYLNLRVLYTEGNKSEGSNFVQLNYSYDML